MCVRIFGLGHNFFGARMVRSMGADIFVAGDSEWIFMRQSTNAPCVLTDERAGTPLPPIRCLGASTWRFDSTLGQSQADRGRGWSTRPGEG